MGRVCRTMPRIRVRDRCEQQWRPLLFLLLFEHRCHARPIRISDGSYQKGVKHVQRVQDRIFAGDGSTRRIDGGNVTSSRTQKGPTEEKKKTRALPVR